MENESQAHALTECLSVLSSYIVLQSVLASTQTPKLFTNLQKTSEDSCKHWDNTHLADVPADHPASQHSLTPMLCLVSCLGMCAQRLQRH